MSLSLYNFRPTFLAIVLALFTTLLLSAVPSSSGAKSEMRLFLAEMKQCSGKEHLAVLGENFAMERRNRSQFFLQGDIVMKKAFPTGFRVKLTIQSCGDMTDKSTCKPFLNQLATDEICLMLKKPFPSYKKFVNSVDPPLLCPLQNITYKIRDFYVPNDLVHYFRKTDKRTYYFIRITGTARGQEVVCFEFYIYTAMLKMNN